MLKEKQKLFKNAFIILDLVLTTLAFLLAYFLRDSGFLGLGTLRPFHSYLLLLYIVLPLWTFLLYFNKAHHSMRMQSTLQVIWPIIKTVSIGGTALIAILFIFKIQTISRILIFLFLSINILLLVVERLSIMAYLRHFRRKGYNFRNILIVGTGKRARNFVKVLNDNKEWGFRVIGYVDQEHYLRGKWFEGVEVIGLLHELPRILTQSQIDEVIFVIPRTWINTVEKAILLCEELGIKARMAADIYLHKIAKTTLEEIQGFPLLTFNPTPHPEGAILFKRAIDIAFSLAFLIFSFPLFLITALCIKLTSSGPVFFKQERCGINNKKFNVLKFRSMLVNAEVSMDKLIESNEMTGPVFKMKRDPRVTPIGRILRKFSLDEIPQFINVLKGEMSIVGPRPPMPSEVEKYDLWHRRRLSMRPGITCLWQVNGRNKICFDDWMKLDLDYIDNWSHTLDFKILLKTVPVVIRGTGM